MELSFYNIFTVVNLFIISILIIFFQVNKFGQIRTNKTLSVLLFIFLLQIIYSFTTSNYEYSNFLKYHKEIFILQKSAFLMGPIMYLYVRLVINPKLILRKTELLHTIPFFVILCTTVYLLKGNDTFIIWKSNMLNVIAIFLILIHNLIYLVLILSYLKIHKVGIKPFFSELAQSNILAWLKFFIFSFILLWIINVYIFATIMIIGDTSWCAFTNSIFALVVFTLVCTWLIILLLKPDMLVIKEKYRNNRLDNAEKLSCEYLLESYLRNNKPYLDPDLSLEKLAKEINLNSRTISQIINEKYNCTFRSYLNTYRIEECASLLSDPDNADKTVLEIMYDAGFNSKSAFNTAFKKYTGLSPVEFRRNCTLKRMGRVGLN